MREIENKNKMPPHQQQSFFFFNNANSNIQLKCVDINEKLLFRLLIRLNLCAFDFILCDLMIRTENRLENTQKVLEVLVSMILLRMFA